MNCVSCGAIVTSDKRRCPYCGARNPEYDRKAVKMRALEREKEAAKQQAKKSFKTIWEDRLCDIFLGAAIVLLIGIIAARSAGINIGTGLKKYKPALSKGDYIEQMEQLYNDGEYEKLYGYMLQNELFEKEDYYKYSQAANITHTMNKFRTAVYPFIEYANGDRADTKYTLSAATVMSEAHFVYDWRFAEGEKAYLEQVDMCPENEQLYNDCVNEVRSILTGYLMLTDEEVVEFLEKDGFYTGGYDEIVKERTGYFEY